MKLLFVLFLAFLIEVVHISEGIRYCISDASCRYDECCVLHFTGRGRVCRDMGDDVGDVCGGLHFCPHCSGNLLCIPVEPLTPVQNKVSMDGTEVSTTPYPEPEIVCPLAANATCQPDLSLIRPFM